MGERALLRPSPAVLLALVAVGVVAASESSLPTWGLGLGSAALAIGQLVRAPAPSGARLSLSPAAACAVALLSHEVLGILAIYALGTGLGWLAARLGGKEPRSLGAFLLSESASLLAFAGAFSVSSEAWHRIFATGSVADLVAVISGALAWFAVRAVASAVTGPKRGRLASRYLWLLALEDWPVVVSLFASGALFAFAFPVMRWWAIPVALMPYGFSHLSFIRYHGTRNTYRQTIRALSRIPEVGGLTPFGHSERTAELALSMAGELGLEPHQVEELEYAALMHDIGRITLNEPAIVKAGYTESDIARWGAQIIAEAPFLHRVARLVADQHRPYRRPGERKDPELPIASQIIRVASEYDQATVDRELPPIEAVEMLHRGAAYDFDPEVVLALRRVLEQRQAIS